MLPKLSIGIILLYFACSAFNISTIRGEIVDDNSDKALSFKAKQTSPSLVRSDGTSQSCASERELRGQSIADKYCDTFLSHSEQCLPYNPSQDWMNSCYCAEGYIYCDVHRSLCCQFKNQDVDWTSVDVPQRRVHLFNSSNLQMHVDPIKVHELYVFNTANVEITMDRDNFTVSGCTFGAVNSKGRNVPLFKTIRLTNSSFYSIPPAQSIHSIRLVHSSVEYLEHLTIDDGENDILMIPEERGSENCFIAEKTNVGKIKELHLKCSGLFNQSEISEVNNLRFEYLDVFDSSFGTITPTGLKMTKYGLRMSNVKIGYLHRESIAAEPNMTISLSNVFVEHCDEPCFLVQNITLLDNVTVNGRQVTEATDSAFLNPSRREYDRLVHVLNEWSCKKQPEAVMSCHELFSHPPIVELYLVNKELQAYNVKVGNHSHLRILEGCQLSVEITNVTGSHFPFQYFTCDHPVPVSIINSNLSAFVAISADHFAAFNSNIEFLNLFSMIRNFSASELRVGEIRKVTFLGQTSRLFRYFGGSIGLIKNLVLHSPAVISNVMITTIENLRIEYWSTPLEHLTIMENCRIRKVEKHGINVENGTVLLRNITVFEGSQEMIRLGYGGKVVLILNLVQYIAFRTDCLFKGPLFSAVFRHQVVFTGVRAPNWLPRCIAYRSAVSGPSTNIRPSFPRPISLDPDTHCTFVWGVLSFVCDVSTIAEPIVLGNSSSLNSIESIRIIGARSLTIGEHCINKIILDRCEVTYMEAYPLTCPLELTIISSVINQIVNDIWNVAITNSTVGIINLNQPHAMKLKHSKVQQLILRKGSTVEIVNTTVTNLQRISIDQSMKVVNCTIIRLGSVVVNRGASLTMSVTSIHQLKRKAISVRGSLTLDNVTLNKPIEGGIWIAKKGKVKCIHFNIPAKFLSNINIFEWEDPKKRYGDVCTE